MDLDINNHFSLRNDKDTMVAKIMVLFYNTYGNIYDRNYIIIETFQSKPTVR